MASKNQDPLFMDLKQKFQITPKTVSILLKLNITDYRSLQDLSTNQLLAHIAAQPDVKKESVSGYRRAVRRIVWLGTQDDPETMGKRCADWTNKSLKARGIWVDDWDDLTGREIDERFGKLLKAEGL